MIGKYTWKGTDPLKQHEGSVFASGNPEELYTLKDFYTAPVENKIDNPIGMGYVVFGLALVGFAFALLDYRRLLRTDWLLIACCWTVVNFINVNANRLPFNINPHRGWSFFAIGAALIATYGAWQLLNLLKDARVRVLGAGVLVALVVFTAAYPKYVVNTSMWPTHYFASYTDIPGYMWLENLPDGTPVTSLCRADEKVIGMDKWSTKMWDGSQLEFQKTSLNHSVDEIYTYEKSKQYDYMILDSSCVQRFGINLTSQRLSEMVNDRRLQLVYPTSQEEPLTTFIFRIT
jgi:hypothetical protein